jgi:hypothetical protein
MELPGRYDNRTILPKHPMANIHQYAHTPYLMIQHWSTDCLPVFATLNAVIIPAVYIFFPGVCKNQNDADS